MSTAVLVVGSVLLLVLVTVVFVLARPRRAEDRYKRAVVDVHRSNEIAARDAARRSRRQPNRYPEPWDG
jgi:hypothetical protein